MKIVFLSHSVEGSIFKVGSHHLSREMAKMGHKVAHISTPLSLPQFLSYRPQNLNDRWKLLRTTPMIDAYGRLSSTFLLPIPLRLAPQQYLFNRHVKSIGFRDADLVFVDQPLMNYGTSFPKAKVIYRPTDVHHEGVIHQRERSLVRSSAALVATSNCVLKSLEPYHPTKPTLVLENGVEFARFNSVVRKHPRTRKRTGAIYVGAVDYRFDWEAIKVIAALLYPEQVRIVGPGNNLPASSASNISIEGAVPYYQIPAELAAARIGLLPFTEVATNEGRSPMKFYEYLAAELFILGKKTIELGARSAAGVYLYDRIFDIEDCIASIDNERHTNTSGAQVAVTYDWSARAQRLLQFCEAELGVSDAISSTF